MKTRATAPFSRKVRGGSSLVELEIRFSLLLSFSFFFPRMPWGKRQLWSMEEQEEFSGKKTQDTRVDWRIWSRENVEQSVSGAKTLSDVGKKVLGCYKTSNDIIAGFFLLFFAQRWNTTSIFCLDAPSQRKAFREKKGHQTFFSFHQKPLHPLTFSHSIFPRPIFGH